MLKTIQLLLIISIFISCRGKSSIMESKVINNKQKVVKLLESIETGATEPVAYINPEKYIQHNLSVKDGLAGFGELLSQLPKGSAKVNVVRVFEDGNYVFAHTEYDFFGPKVGFDVFRFENGLIVEHWDNLSEIVDKTVSGRSQFDGTTQILDQTKTEENKQFISAFLDDILMGKNPSKITDYISSEKYLQHNPKVADGLDGLGEALKELSNAGMPMTYTKNHKILGEGNFVLSISEGEFLKNMSHFMTYLE